MTELEKAKATYKTATASGKAALEAVFGKSAFAGNIVDRIKSFKDAYPAFKKMKFKDPLFLILQKRKENELTSIDRLLIVAEVLRDGQQVDFDNSDHEKYYPYFIRQSTKTGFGFSNSAADYGSTCTHVGSRLCFLNEEVAKYFGTQFISEWNEFLNIKH